MAENAAGVGMGIRIADANPTPSNEDGPIGSLGGMHRCYLSEPMHLDSMSPDLCAFTGYTIDELVGEDGYARYTNMLHPDDVMKYGEFCEALATSEGPETVTYRIVKKSGEVVEVTDTMVSRRDRQGVVWGIAIVILSDGRSASLERSADVQDSSEYGSIDLSLGDSEGSRPRILNCNDYFLKMVGIPDDIVGSDRSAAVVTVNLLLADQVKPFIPDNVRSRPYSTFYSQGFLRTVNAQYVEVSCWGKARNLKDEAVCRVTVVPVPQESYADQIRNKVAVLGEMSELYDLVFDFDLTRRNVRCVHAATAESAFNTSCDIPLEMDKALSDWTSRYLTEESRRRMVDDLTPLTNMGIFRSPYVLTGSYTALVHGRETPIALFAYRDSGIMLVAIRMVDKAVEAKTEGHRVEIRTFGYFEVFVDGKPLIFKHPKSRELFAILVDRQGGMVPSRVAASMLWDDKEPDATVMARYRKIAMYLAESLDEAGVSYLVESAWGSRRAVLSLADCDLMEYLKQDGEASHPFNGAYMKEYSWAEATLGELLFRAESLAK